MPTVQSNAEMQKCAENIIAYFAHVLPDAVQNMVIPRFVACDYETKTLELAYETKPWMRNPANILHGGLAAMMLDNTMGILSHCFVHGAGITPTITMEIAYLLPVPIGTELHVRARATHTGRAINNLMAEAWAAETPGKLALTASGAFYAAGAETTGNLAITAPDVFHGTAAEKPQ